MFMRLTCCNNCKPKHLQDSEMRDLTGIELVRESRDNVLIETLLAGKIGLPVVAEPRFGVKHEASDNSESHNAVLL